MVHAAAVAVIASLAGGEPDRTYLKKDGDGWVQVRRGPAALEILGRAEAPAPPPVPSGAGDLFQPWVAYATSSWPEAVAIGDITGDWLPDVAMVTSFYFDPANDYKLFVFAQRPDGTLAPPVRYATWGTYTERPETVAIGDLNGDGRNDVVVGHEGRDIGVYLQNAAGGLEAPVLYPMPDSKCVRIADLNRDWRLDVVGLGWGTNTVTVRLQQPDGTLGAAATYAAPHSGYDDLDTGDVNGDGLTDVVVMSGQLYATPNVSVLYQQPNGTLGGLVSRFIGTNILSHGIAVGDLNADGRNDVLATYGGNSPGAGIALFRQQFDGSLGNASTYPSYDIPEPVEIADVDGNGFGDIVVAHGGWVALGVYRQTPAGQLLPEERYPIPYASHYNPHGLAVGDIDQDGADDVVIADYNSGLVVLRHAAWAVTVTAPNTPVTWQIGTTQAVTWTSNLPPGSAVDIALSRNGGAAWETIASGVPDTGSFAWTVTGPPTTAARVRVAWMTFRPDAPPRVDASDADFTIATTLSGPGFTPRSR